MIYPFEINDYSLDFAEKHYPDLATLKKINLVSHRERVDIVRIYFTEGIPFAFIKNPILYEKIRVWLAKHFEVDPKSISITGSARIGYTLNPNKVQGTAFAQNSDLDLILVDEKFFNYMVDDYFSFVEQLNSKLSQNYGRYEHLLNNTLEIERSITRFGFIDQWKIPDWSGLPKVNIAYSHLRHLTERMSVTNNCPRVSKASIRIYKDWESCVNRLSININAALK
ncbi:MAG: hypothetical protein JNJ41_08535 [Bacteroidia bacterium]|nr:hypothetical protein [Bacteroidia bacterium]